MVWNLKMPVNTHQKFSVANYITKLRGLKLKFLRYIARIIFGCKLYHKTTWFETTSSLIGDCVLPGCKLYHKTTWFETSLKKSRRQAAAKLQIISQNYVVWNWDERGNPNYSARSCKLYHKTTWFETIFTHCYLTLNLVANYITKLRGLKPNSGKIRWRYN